MRISSFLLIPLYTKNLSISDYGILATLLLTIQFLMKLINFGLLNSLMRFMSEYKESERIGKFLGSAIVLNLASGTIISIVSAFILSPILKTVFHTTEVSNYIVLTTLAAFAQSLCINIMSYYRANNQGPTFSVLNIIIALLIIGGNIFVIAYTNLAIAGVLLVQIAAYGSMWIIIAAKIISVEKIGFSKEIFSRLFKFGYPLIFANMGGLLVNTTSVYFLGYFTDLKVVAIYSLALKIAQISSMVLVLPFQYAYEPFVFSNITNKNIKSIIARLTSYLIIAFYFISFLIIFFFRDLIKVISPEEYHSAYNYVFLLLPAIAFTGLSYIGQSLLHIKSKTKTTGFTIGTISGISVLLNYFLIQHIGINGLIITYNFKLISVGLLMMYLGIKSFPIELEWRRLITTGFIFLITFLTVFLFHNLSAAIYYSILPLFILMLTLYFCFSSFFHESEKEKITKLLSKTLKVWSIKKSVV